MQNNNRVKVSSNPANITNNDADTLLFCINCGSKITEEMVFCESCGTKIDKMSLPAKAQKNYITKNKLITGIVSGIAILLCCTIIFGWANPILIRGQWELREDRSSIGVTNVEFFGDDEYVEYHSKNDSHGEYGTYYLQGNKIKLRSDYSSYSYVFKIKVSLTSMTLYGEDGKKAVYKRVW